MKKLFIIPTLAILLAVFLVQLGCNSSDGPGTPDPEDCSITVSGPAAGASYQSGDAVNVNWNETGTASQAELELLKDGTLVGSIGTVTNDGYKRWYAETLGAVSGNDFAIRVTAIGEEGCTDTSDEFTILNTADCSLAFTMADTAFLDAGMVYEVTWESDNTTGFVDLELLRDDLPPEEPIGYITTNIQDTGYYEWTVDSLHQGTYGFFYLRISDPAVDDCSIESGRFAIIDDEICEIWVNSPQSGTVWTVDESQVIIFTAPDPNTTHVNVNLYEGFQWVNTIAPNVPTTGDLQEIQWTVNTLGSQSAGTAYKIKISDASDSNCLGWSSNITILEN